MSRVGAISSANQIPQIQAARPATSRGTTSQLLSSSPPSEQIIDVGDLPDGLTQTSQARSGASGIIDVGDLPGGLTSQSSPSGASEIIDVGDLPDGVRERPSLDVLA